MRTLTWLTLLTLTAAAAQSLPKPPPSPTAPVYTQLKALHLSTILVATGEPAATIVVPEGGTYARDAKLIADVIREMTGVLVPTVTDSSPTAAVPLTSTLVVLGNRSTNRTIEELYNRHYALLDLRYPGRRGHVVRTLHNPFGAGHNIVLVGGSDASGVHAAAKRLTKKLEEAGGGPGELKIGRLADIKLGRGVNPQPNLSELQAWEASSAYVNGNFGWNMISKLMALYYMTGNEHYAREFLRYAFPDAAARKEILAIDGAKATDPNDPLNGRSHYHSHMMALYWDLIEESPVFTNEERLKVTNALARQLPMRINVDYTGKHMWRPKEPPRLVSSRHGQCGAICLYTVARYFCRDYPDPTWEYAAMVAKRVFAPLHERAGVVGEFDTHFWYSTSMEQVLNYMLLSGDRVPLENGMLETLLNGHETLISGRPEHWSLNYAAIGYLHKAAYLRNDGAWIRYRERTGVDVDTFRVGQSFWPDRQLAAKEPDALVGKWLVHRVPKPLWEHRELKTPLESAFQFMSFRSRPDRTGDFLLLDGLYGKGRNPYHVFPIVELRLNGHTVLTEFRNQISVTVDGQVPEKMPVSAGLLHHSVLGDAVTAIAEVPDMTHCHWRRSLVQRIGRYALIVDELIMAADSDNVDVEIGWEGPYPEWNAERVLVRMNEDHESQKAPWYNIIPADPATGVVENYAITPGKRAPLARVGFIRAARKGEQLNFFSLIAPEKAAPLCMRSGDNTAALRLPTPGRVVLGSAGSTRAGLAILAADHLYGHDLETAGGEDTLIRAQTPVEVWWDFESGRLEIHTTRETRLALCLAAPKRVTLDGAPVHVSVTDGVTELTVSEGRHHLRGAKPDKSMLAGLASVLANDTRMASARRNSWQSPDAPEHLPAMPSLSPAFTVPIGGDVSDMVVAPDVDSPRIYAAIGNTVHALNADGQTEWSATTEGEIKVIHWWSEHQLLLLGCRDEKVIAFAADGERKWEFVSEMDAEFTRNAIATHWFKNAHPTHRGIHGLHTGVFIDGKSQAFVGSACTIEIIDENGQFLKRIVQKWGRVATFLIADGSEGSLNLWATKEMSLRNSVGVISNRTLRRPRVGRRLRAGGTRRRHLFYEDLDGDGVKEIVCDILGTWNRIVTWDTDGEALHTANFKPGSKFGKFITDVDVADLDGDGKHEIVVSTSSGLILALDHECRKIWAARTPAPAAVIKIVHPPASEMPVIVAGCRNGTVAVLSNRGATIRCGSVPGRPQHIDAIEKDGKRYALIATDKGRIHAFPAEAAEVE